MNVFLEIEGKKSENLTTAVLRLLLLRSHEVRTAFLKCISAAATASALGPLPIQGNFSCTLEVPTLAEEGSGAGRLDLILETSSVVVGVENKLFANFQDGQPQKYVNSIASHTTQLSRLRKSELEYLVVVLAPEGRAEEVKRRIEGDSRLAFVTWETVLAAFEDVREALDPETEVLRRNLSEYLNDQFALLPRFDEWVPHLRAFTGRISSRQKELVQKLWRFFPEAGPKLGSGDVWAGYYLGDWSSDVGGWFGYVAASTLATKAKHQAELIVATTYSVEASDPPFRAVEIKNAGNFINRKRAHVYSWAIDFDESWNKPEVWREKLKPFRDAVDSRRSAANEGL